MDVTTLTILRMLHITCGVFWAGFVMYMAFFIIPAVNAAGPIGGRFMQQLTQTRRMPAVMMAMAVFTIISGVWLLWLFSGGLNAQWMGSRHGIILSTGGTTAIIAFFIGLIISRPAATRMAALGKEMGNNPPTEAQAQELTILRNKLRVATNVIALLLLVSVVTMSIAQHL